MARLKKNLKELSHSLVPVVGLAILVIALLWGVSSLNSGSRQYKRVEKKTTLSEADFHLKAVTFREFQRERPVWKMVAEDARIFRDDDKALIKNISSTFYQENGNDITLTGNEGRIKLSSMNISISGDVYAKSSDGTQLFAENFQWDNQKRQATSQDSIRIIRNNVQIEGVGLELDPDQQLLTIKKEVRTFIGNDEG